MSIDRTHRTRTTSVTASSADLVAAVSPLDPGLGRLLADCTAQVSSMEWAEQEIKTARDRNPRHADAIYHSFRLFAYVDDHCIRAEPVYRSHCRELLARVVDGSATTLPTHAEMCSVISETSLRAPLSSAGYGLYLRLYRAAGLPDIPELVGDTHHYEAVHRTAIDAHERGLRSKLANPDRHLRDVVCGGGHHGVPAPYCRFAATGRRPRTGT